MSRQEGKARKFRCKGAETRRLMFFGLECAQAMYNHVSTTHNLTIPQCVSSLMYFYHSMPMETWRLDVAGAACRKCCL
eukprot:11219082-Lingulodinium_polyedra.AAC.1